MYGREKSAVVKPTNDGERHQEDVERVDEELLVPDEHRPVANDPEHEHRRGDQRAQAHEHVHLRGVAARTDQRQDHGAEQGDPENEK